MTGAVVGIPDPGLEVWIRIEMLGRKATGRADAVPFLKSRGGNGSSSGIMVTDSFRQRRQSLPNAFVAHANRTTKAGKTLTQGIGKTTAHESRNPSIRDDHLEQFTRWCTTKKAGRLYMQSPEIVNGQKIVGLRRWRGASDLLAAQPLGDLGEALPRAESGNVSM
jgi:hypothetical protein